MAWDQHRLSEHGEPVTAARGCPCDTCHDTAELLQNMYAERVGGATYAWLTDKYGWSQQTIKKYIRIMEGSPE